MKREIKFRGMRSDGVWVYGMLSKTKETVSEDGQISYTGKYNYLIHSNEGHIGTWLVDEDTVGQFTGLKDKNGVDIYEGDLLRVESYNFRHFNLETWEVFYSINFCMFKIRHKNYSSGEDFYGLHSLEVIGNIHEKTQTKWKNKK